MTGKAPPVLRTFLAFAPLAVLGIGAGVLQTLARRATDPRRRRAYGVAWILALVAGAPLWLFAAAALGLL